MYNSTLVYQLESQRTIAVLLCIWVNAKHNFHAVLPSLANVETQSFHLKGTIPVILSMIGHVKFHPLNLKKPMYKAFQSFKANVLHTFILPSEEYSFPIHSIILCQCTCTLPVHYLLIIQSLGHCTKFKQKMGTQLQ